MSTAPVIAVYTTSVAFSVKLKKDQQNLRWLLEKKGVQFEEFDVASDDKAKQTMQEKSGKRTLPQVFVDDKFYGGYDELLELEEVGELDHVLGLKKE
mmetsp:Transcript_7341/g.11171  ORF Transcript_7341/g.11171 Transcript_7341/m.11171 type:complete len:97 (-) Transcript_7341:42-332(-)|eukprot:CAMPEP_0201551034 /NCGR_PEP_ID=MMETSP0173_2-20130828/7281_1 /ASSEMBLY_ACC=CAM_ASM_000268 /TAXON_ID=218659 /ORGANISM="Vexillifera sp., Strain DIVA3 564/2" /LENGTH=96 /DNA_ID=CAMNT_0047961181 /DNA_START=44 /DNA_END=334 /DNA_ORIENTATION=-